MPPTHQPDNSHHSHDANNANATKNARKRVGFMRRTSVMLIALVVVGVLASVFVWRHVYAANILWSSAAGSAWLTGSNWTGGTVPTATDVAQFGANPTGTGGVGINMNSATNNGANNQAVGAIEQTTARTLTPLIIGDSSTTVSGTLTLNGATVNSVGNVILRNASGQLLTIQDIQGGAGARTMAVALGNATDNIINLDNVGGITISSIISGVSRKLTLGGAGFATLTLNGVNTYSGDTTITSGRLSLGTLGQIQNSPNINIAGGAFFDVATRGGYTLAINQGLRGTGTATTGNIQTATGNSLTLGSSSPLQFTAFNGGTAPLTILGTGSVTVASGNPVTVNTTSALGAGDYTLIQKGSSAGVLGSIPTSLTIGGSGLAAGAAANLQLSTGSLVLHVVAASGIKFRSATSGNWNSNSTWEMSLDGGTNWVAATSTPTSANDTVSIQSGHTVTVTAAVTTDQTAVDSGGTLTVSNGVTMTVNDVPGTDLLVQGTLTMTGESVINGLGTFNLASAATLNIGSANGIVQAPIPTGNIQTLNKIYNGGANYTYNGSAAQVTGAGLPSLTAGATLTINNSAGVTLSQATTVTFDVTLTSGTFTIGSDLTLANLCIIDRAAGSFSGTPNFGANVFVSYLGPSVNSGTEIPASPSVLRDLATSGAPFTVTLTTDATVNNVFLLNGGSFDTGPNVLTIKGTRSYGSGRIIGNERRVFSGPGSFTFDVGTANGYTPVTMNVTAGTFPADFTIKANQGAMPGISGANKLARYWNLTNTTITNADLTFNYLAGDVTGTAANYKFIKKTGGALSVLNPTGTPTTTSATINGVTSFSDWTLAEAAAVQSGTLQFSAANFNDNETNADHTATITVTRTGGSDGDVGVTYNTSDASALLSDPDYVAASGTLSWSDGDSTSKSFNVTVKGDTTYESHETVNLTLSLPTGGATIGALNPSMLTILNDDNPPTTLVVNTTADGDDAFCLSDPGGCTLREAINAANANADTSTIDFNIPVGMISGGVYTIQPTGTLLPFFTRRTNIDGATQTVFTGDTNANGPEVVINGSLLSGTPNGLYFDTGSGSSVVSNLVINGFGGTGLGVVSGSVQVLNNYLGTNAAGTVAVANAAGLSVGSSATLTGSYTISGNLISGNTAMGISTCDVQNSTFSNNKLGTDAAGTGNVGNGSEGMHTFCGTFANNTISGNTIAFNGSDGFRDQPDYGGGGANNHPNNRITQNSFFDNVGLGINLLPPPNNTVDGVTPNDSGDTDLGGNGLQNFPVLTSSKVTGATKTIKGTLNTNANSTSGYTIEFFSNVICDPSGNGEGKTYLGNVTTGNTNGSGDVSFTFHPASLTIGDIITATATDVNGNTSEFSACINTIAGTAGSVQFSAANYNDSETNADHTATITVTRTGGTDGNVSVSYDTSNGTATITGNDYVGSSGALSWLEDDATSKTFDVTVKGDVIYEADETVNLTLSVPLGGVSIGAPNPATLTIINDDAPPTTLVVNTTADGDDGFCLAAPGGCTLREAINAANANADTSTIDFNIPVGMISGGVYTIQPTGTLLPFFTRRTNIDGATQTAFTGDTNVNGPEVVINGSLLSGTPNGLYFDTGSGSSVVSNLVINGFGGTGLGVVSGSVQVLNNYLGTNAAGTAAVANAAGLSVGSSATLTGSYTISGNLISGNTAMGISTCDVQNSTFSNNKLGTNAAGTGNVGNGSEGMHTFCGTFANNTISGNTIAFNGSDGFRDQPDYGGGGANNHPNNRITQNSFFDNGGLGINLLPPPNGNVDGVTPNDLGDADNGGNKLQNFPVLTAAITGLPNTITGTLNTTPNSTSGYVIEFFSNTACDASGNGEGKTYLGSVTTGNTNGSGNVGFTFNPGTLNVGDVITATATDINGNTSEFSACFTATAGETSVAVSGGNLVITDANGGTSVDTLTISLNGANVRINDPNNTLTAGAGATQIDANTVEVPLASISGNIQVNTLGGNDTLTLALAGGDFIPAGGVNYAGGTQTSTPGDRLVITGGSQGTVTYNYTNANDGNVVMSAFGTVTYTGLEPITNSGTAADVIFNLPAGPNAATLADDGTGGNTLSTLSGATFEATTFANPTGSVTINRGNAADTLTTGALPDLNSSVTIGTGANPFSAITFGGALTLAANQNLSGDASSTISFSTGASDLATSGTGTIALTTARDISLVTGSSITVVNGALSLNANQQVVPTSGNFNGVVVDGGTLQSTGSGNVAINGRGGEGAFNAMYGVIVWNAGKILSTGTGTITVQGTGGARTSGPVAAASEVFGVYVYLLGSEISSASGAIQITGQGGATNDTSSYGVIVAGGKIQTSGAGTLTINGTGGIVTGGHPTPVDSAGFFVVQDDAITPAAGVIASTGSGVNAGNIVITGISGPAGAGAGQGLRVDAPGTVTTVDGSITLDGTGGACGNACLGTSIRGAVAATGTGAIDITGTGAASTGAFPTHGVNLRGGGAVTTTSGNITVTGTGGNGTDNAGFNLVPAGAGTGTLQTTGGGTITVNADTIKINTSALATIDAGASSVSLRQKTNGVAINLGSAVDNTASTVELSDGELDRIFGGTLNFGNASSGAITVSASISRAAATVLSLVSGANIDIAGGSLNSAGGNVTLNPNTNVFPSHAGVDVTTGAAATLALTSGKDLKIDIDGTTFDTGYTQLNVAGLVNLNSANLSFAGSSYTPVGGESFIVVNNDGADAITGTFANGPTFTNFLGSGLTATISYSAGDGNDAVLTVAAACVPPAIVYVDDSWVGTTPGTDPDMGGPATNFGCDSFATIQDGVNGVATSGTVNVAAGNYIENVTIPKALTLTGAGAASVFVYPALSAPNTCVGASLCPGGSNIMLVQANNVTISGMTLDGDNTSLPGGINVGGANVDARNGIITNHLMGVFNNLEVHHTTVKNIYLRGVYASSGGSFNFHDNTVQNVQGEAASIGMFSFSGAGAYTNNTVSACNDAISANHSRGITFTGNTVTTSASGIHSDNAGDGGGTSDTISGNTVTNSTVNGYGIWTFVSYLPITVSNNTVTNVDVGLASAGGISTPVATTFTGNTVDAQNKANSTGVYLTTSQFGFGEGNNLVEFRSNTVVNATDGFYLEANTFPIANGPTNAGRALPVTVDVGEPGYHKAYGKEATAPDAVFTLTVNAHFNRIVNHTGTAATSVGAGNVVADFENNWWGCNAGPNNVGCGNIVGGGIDFDPWIVLGISASPSTIPPGGSTTVTADMTHNSNNAVPSVTDFVPQVAVTFGATNGTVFPTSGTITNGQATTTFTSNSTSSGSASATVDNQTVNTPINVSAANTYTWSPTLGTSWILPVNWTPTRFLPQATDNLIINGTTTPAPTITNVPTETIAGLHLINSAQATLQAGGTNTLTISGATGSDLTVPAGNLLKLDGSNGLTIKVSGLGTTGTIGGVVIAQGGFHRLFGDASGVITFQSGGIGTAGPGLTSNMFGTGAVGDGDAGSVIFANGSFYFHNAGGSPFGVAPNPAVVVFQSGSLATFLTASGFEGNGRTYAALAIGKVDPGGVAVNASDGGTGNFQFDHLLLNSTGTTNSSLTYNGSGTSAINIRERIDSNGVGNGGTLPDVILTAGSGGIVMNKPGQTVVFDNDGSNARAVEFESSATVGSTTQLQLNDRKLLVGISQPSSFVLTVNGLLGGDANGYVIGNVKRPVTTTPDPFIFHVGTPNGYSPLDAVFTAGTGDLTVLARQGAQPVLTSATSLQRYWTLTEGGAITADLTFHYNQADVMGNEANYRLVIVESGNATSFPENCPNVACVDESANTIRRTSVTTFSDWTAAEPAAPTAVKLTGFSATRSGDEVRLQWQSGYEARNLGYNVYREQDGKRVAITPSLVAGSALVAGNATRLTAGLAYSWTDDGGRTTAGGRRATAVDGQQSPVSYWLEDVDINGTRTLHGPIAIAECGLGNADCKKLSERSKLLGELTNQQSAISNQQSNGGVQLSGWPAAITTPDTRTDEPDPTDMQRTIAGMTGLKISVSRSGWYRITQPEVLAAGLNVADANGLQLYRDGRQVAFRLSNSSEQFGPTDYLEFYGEALNSPTAAAQTYYLVKLAEPGKRVEVKEQAVGPGDRVSPTGFAYTVERKERMIYFSGLLNGDAENFFGQVVSTTSATAAIPVNHLDPIARSAGTPVQLEVALQGVTNQSHLVQVRFNGTDLGTINFANTDHPSQTFSIPAAAVLDGNNNVELTALGGAADVSLVDVLRLTYIRSYVADSNALSFNLESRQTKKLTGFTSDHIRVVDVTDPNEPLELTPHISPDGAGFAALIGVDKEVRAPFSRPHKLLAFADGQADTVEALGLNEPSSLWSETAGADYVMISTAGLKASVEPLAQLRRNQGMVVHVVDVEDLYDEFSFGEHSPRAIHDYLAGAMSNWTRKPHYLLLAGDASYDPKNYSGQGSNDLVPTKLIDTALMETASDDWLVDFNGDGMADISVGRLPTRTAGETSALVSKIAGYENAAPDPSRGALLVADTSFEAPSSAVQSLLPSGMTVATVNRSSADDATIHNQIIAGLNQGPLVANYLGHGSNGVWTGASLLSTNDAPTLTNTNRLSVFTMMTCFNGFFQDAYNDSLSEALLKSPGGAVAVWASTTLTEPGGQNAIDQEFYRLLFGAQPATLGDAARAAKLATTDADVRRSWTLFGDPAMRLR